MKFILILLISVTSVTAQSFTTNFKTTQLANIESKITQENFKVNWIISADKIMEGDIEHIVKSSEFKIIKGADNYSIKYVTVSLIELSIVFKDNQLTQIVKEETISPKNKFYYHKDLSSSLAITSLLREYQKIKIDIIISRKFIDSLSIEKDKRDKIRKEEENKKCESDMVCCHTELYGDARDYINRLPTTPFPPIFLGGNINDYIINNINIKITEFKYIFIYFQVNEKGLVSKIDFTQHNDHYFISEELKKDITNVLLKTSWTAAKSTNGKNVCYIVRCLLKFKP